jgi:hypothetical protein
MDDANVGRTGGRRAGGGRLLAIIGVLLAALATIAVGVTPGTATAASPATAHGFASAAPASTGEAAAPGIVSPRSAGSTKLPAVLHAHDSAPICTFDGLPLGNVIEGVVPGTVVSISCTGWQPSETVYAAEASPLYFTASGSSNDVDVNDQQTYTTSPTGGLTGTFTIPTFTAADPAAVCPPGADQLAEGLWRCGVLMTDNVFVNGGYQGFANVAVGYAYGPFPPPAATVVGMAATRDGGGYWVAWSDGSVDTQGDANWFGDASTLTLSAPITHIVATSDGDGYWLVAADGGTFAYGDAGFFGSMGGQPLNQPVVDLAPTRDGMGYWLVASDGGIFAFGDAGFHGSMGGQHLNRPVVGIAGDNLTGGYWEVATDGGIFAFGAPFFGSTGSLQLNKPINGMTATVNDLGYLFVASDGGVFAFGDAPFHGSAGSLALNAPVVGMALDPVTGGYWLVGADGGIFAFGCPFYGAG